ncbi:MAG: carbohydrate ABC transporter permease [Vallitaleaceae bacterium]|nr:carbohydrate ABC transporter permease [Vallitaleaceae bacterium]
MSKKQKVLAEEKYSVPAYLGNGLMSRSFDVFNLALLVFIALTCVLPIWYTLCVSLSQKSYAAAGLVTLWPRGFNFSAYIRIMEEANFWRSCLTSLIRVCLGTSVSIVVVILMSYPLSKTKKEIPGRDVIMWVLIFCMLFNGGIIPWFQTMKMLHLNNNIWGLVLGNGLPMFHVILMMNFFRNLPKELEEAAAVDGAGPWYTLVKIVVPISKPVIATIVLFTAVYHWNEFFNGLVLINKTEDYPLQTYIQQMVVTMNTAVMSEEQYKALSEMSNQTLNAAKLFIASIPVMIVYPFLQKYFISGITLGSVKE